MSRYLRLSKPARRFGPAGPNGSTGPTPTAPPPATARRFALDYAGWCARLVGANGGTGSASAGRPAILRLDRPDPGRQAA